MFTAIFWLYNLGITSEEMGLHGGDKYPQSRFYHVYTVGFLGHSPRLAKHPS